MLRWSRKNLKPVARGLLAALASLWLVAAAVPCVMAQSHPMHHASTPCPLHDGVVHANADECGPVTAVDCKLPDINTLLAATLNIPVFTPALLATLPASIVLPDSGQPRRRDWRTPDIPAPPLHIQHLVLLI